MSFFGNRRQAEQPAVTSGAQRPEAPPAASTSHSPVGFETVLGASCSLEGTLRSHGNIRLDGTFTGTLEITGNVLVGETAKINADIHARNVSIAGAVRGNISGKKVQILRTGRVWGDIQAVALTTEEGAFIDGKITMSSPDKMNNDEKPQSPTGASQDENYDRSVPRVQPVGVGATEEDPDDMIHDPTEPSSPLVENISANSPEVQGAQTDSAEGQASDPTNTKPDDETKQST